MAITFLEVKKLLILAKALMCINYELQTIRKNRL